MQTGEPADPAGSAKSGDAIGSDVATPKRSLPRSDKAMPTDEEASAFVRLSRDSKKQPLALETAVVSHVPRDCGQSGPSVDLVAAVHVADKGYYDELNRLFEQYEVVLYEMIAPEGARIPKGGGPPSSHPISVFQHTLTRFLDLEFQLRAVDYTKKNMIHADMSPEQFAVAMRQRGESFWTIVARVMGHALAQDKDYTVADARLLMALFDRNQALALKRVLAEEFLDLEGSVQAIEGPNGSAIISDRNRVALRVLRKQIDAGKQKIAIFYGAGHMPDLQQRLRDEFSLTPIRTRWLVAWNLKPPPSQRTLGR